VRLATRNRDSNLPEHVLSMVDDVQGHPAITVGRIRNARYHSSASQSKVFNVGRAAQGTPCCRTMWNPWDIRHKSYRAASSSVKPSVTVAWPDHEIMKMYHTQRVIAMCDRCKIALHHQLPMFNKHCSSCPTTDKSGPQDKSLDPRTDCRPWPQHYTRHAESTTSAATVSPFGLER
jgi:hypothetical protein